MATTSEARHRASAKYDRENTVTITMKLNKTKDADILEWLSEQKNRQGTIKRLIRNQIELEDTMLP